MSDEKLPFEIPPFDAKHKVPSNTAVDEARLLSAENFKLREELHAAEAAVKPLRELLEECHGNLHEISVTFHTDLTDCGMKKQITNLLARLEAALKA